MASKKAKTKGGKGWAVFAAILSLLCAATLIIGICSNWFTQFWRWSKADNGNTKTDELYAPDAGLSINQITSDGIELTSAIMPLSDFAAYSLDNDVAAVKTLTATFTPEDTTLQKVDYTCEWRDPNDSWARNKDVNDYITLSQSSDGSLDCAVSLKDAIGAFIKITCTARPLVEGDWVPSATCQVGYYKRVTAINSITFTGSTYDSEGEEVGGYNLIFTNTSNASTLTFENFNAQSSNNIYANPAFGTGTTSINRKDTVKLSVTDEMKSALQGVVSGTFTADMNNYNAKFQDAIVYILHLGDANIPSSSAKRLYEIFAPKYNAGIPTFEFIVTVTNRDNNTEQTFKVPVLFNPIAFGTKATGLNLSDTNITFSLDKKAVNYGKETDQSARPF